MAMSQTTANWHWKTKHVSGWAREWFTSELSAVSATEGDDAVKIEKVTEVDGDVELGQRKSKLITIYDCKIALIWSATGAGDTSIEGTITIPEVSHENTLDGVSDYTYEYTTTSSSGDSAQVAALLTRVKSILPPLLEAKFRAFPRALIDTHGRDLTVIAGEDRTPSGSGAVTPARQPISTASKATAVSSTSKSATSAATAAIKTPKASTETQKVSGHFQASAQDLWGMLTDERRIPLWSQAPAQSNPTEGGSWSILGGAVVGTYITLEPHEKIVQQWKMAKAPGWPSDHWARLEIKLNQGDDSTELEMVMSNVPQGKEQDVQQGLENYYIRGFKSIGLGI